MRVAGVDHGAAEVGAGVIDAAPLPVQAHERVLYQVMRGLRRTGQQQCELCHVRERRPVEVGERQPARVHPNRRRLERGIHTGHHVLHTPQTFGRPASLHYSPRSRQLRTGRSAAGSVTRSVRSHRPPRRWHQLSAVRASSRPAKNPRKFANRGHGTSRGSEFERVENRCCFMARGVSHEGSEFAEVVEAQSWIGRRAASRSDIHRQQAQPSVEGPSGLAQDRAGPS
jgi:hypothetical protein